MCYMLHKRVIFTISIKDYAQDSGVSYEAVRRQVKRYSEELKGHVQQQGRTQFLDEVAVAFLNEHRAQNPVVVYDKGHDEKIQELITENENLRDELDAYKTKLIQAQSQLLLGAQTQAMLEAAQSNLESKNQEIDQLHEAAKDDAAKLAASEEREKQAQADFQNLKEAAEAEIQRLKEEAEAMQRDFDAEKERPLTWRERLFGRTMLSS